MFRKLLREFALAGHKTEHGLIVLYSALEAADVSALLHYVCISLVIVGLAGLLWEHLNT